LYETDRLCVAAVEKVDKLLARLEAVTNLPHVPEL
jgi:hypothetical protein